jgi:predicted small lipoprotein YifL
MLSIKQRILVSRLILAASVAVLGACGQQGPLYLPTEPAAAGRATLPETLRPGGLTATQPSSTASSPQ